LTLNSKRRIIYEVEWIKINKKNMKITSTKRLAPLIAIIIVLVIGTGIIVYQSLKTRNEAITTLTSTTLSTETTPTTVLSPTTTITTSPSVSFCLDWDFFKDPKNYDDGQVHEEIKLIQEKLGVTPVGGHYGSLTKAAIEAFNKKYDIHQEIDCCMPRKDYKSIYQGTISKFNELYCDKPLYQITITRKNNPDICSNGSSFPVVISKILNYPKGSQELENNQSITMKVPYSSGVRIVIGTDADIADSGNNHRLSIYISKIYNNSNLVAYYENNKFAYVGQIETYCKTLDTKNFQFNYGVPSDLQLFVIKNIKSDYNILIETEGCRAPAG